ncbi:hypothetical protein [Tenacibaculum sp. IB213877]|uniref:hypothetical protein n=1 Tax=Tenacibaculum sp. IB213877 TaxID=3097351 RepID=UPI002A5AF40E|nr:hypothetical protein [Tenacibaculum sp. IB213877]MDY0781583.1 hypothetical protein [Tenacibaculum sp. IB213877]
MKNVIFLIIFLFCLNSYSQEFKNITIIKSDKTEIKTLGTFVYEDDLIKGIKTKKNNLLISFQDVNKVFINKETYLVKNYKFKKYLFLKIINGNLSLYKDKKNYYLENNELGLKNIKKDEKRLQFVFKTGEVSLFINKCKAATNELYNKRKSLILSNLKKIINIYNTCDTSSKIQFADEVIKESNRPKEKVKFGLSFGLMKLKTDYNQPFSIEGSDKNFTFVGGKVYIFSNIFQEKLDANLSIDYFFRKNYQINDIDYYIKNSTQFTKLTIGANYTINNISKLITPYFGISGGLLLSSNSSVKLISKYLDLPSRHYTLSNELIYNINVGSYIYLLNQKIDLIFEYQPKINTKLSDSINLHNNSSSFSSLSFKLSYIF